MRAVWILWCIRIGMVHSVQNRISSWRQVRTTLPDPSKKVKETLPVFAHHKHLVGGVSVKEETLAKQGEIPVQQEEDNYNH